jgi:hypothetical protein
MPSGRAVLKGARQRERDREREGQSEDIVSRLGRLWAHHFSIL